MRDNRTTVRDGQDRFIDISGFRHNGEIVREINELFQDKITFFYTGKIITLAPFAAASRTRSAVPPGPSPDLPSQRAMRVMFIPPLSRAVCSSQVLLRIQIS